MSFPKTPPPIHEHALANDVSLPPQPCSRSLWMIPLFRRPGGAEWVPQWMNLKEVDSEIELEVDPDECHYTDDEDEIEDSYLRRLHRQRSLKKRPKESKDQQGRNKSVK